MLWMLPLKRYFQFSGRSGRAEYWQFVAALIIANIVIFIVEFGSASAYEAPSLTLSALLLLITACPLYAVTFRRLHDRNASGWLVGAQFALNGGSAAVERIRASLDPDPAALPFQWVGWALLAATAALALYLLVQVCLPGDDTDNRYGPPPQAADAAASAIMKASITTMAERAKVPVASAQPDALDQLERLAKLHADGVLTDDEFQAQKAAVLGRPGR